MAQNKLELGKIYTSEAIGKDSERNRKFNEFTNSCLQKHEFRISGGNRKSLELVGRTMSSYVIPKTMRRKGDKEIRVITETKTIVTTTIIYSKEY